MRRLAQTMARCAAVALLVTGSGIAGPLADASADELVDEVVAVVDRHLITRSEVREEALLVQVKRRGEAGLAQRITPEFLKQILQALIDQQVLLVEARRVGLPLVTDRERQLLLEGFRRLFANRASYERFLLEHGLSETSIAEALVRHQRIDRLREAKLNVMPEVTDEEVHRYFETHRLDFGTAPLRDVAAAIRLRLSRQRRERELARWISELSKRSEVKVLVDLTAKQEGGHGG